MIKKLLGQPVHENKSETNLSFDSRIEKVILRPSTSQSASHVVGASLACLDASVAGDFAVVAGEKVFKVLKVEGNRIREETDLRAAMLNPRNNHNETISSFRDRLNIECARWMHGSMSSVVLAASANGKLALYDVNRPGSEIEVGRIKEHDRKIHNIAVNPNRYQQFLTACQDGTARLFDINESDLGRGKVFYKRNAYRASGDAIRDIKWSPTRGFDFAVATSSGSVQLWDRRQEHMPVLDLKTAHRGPCTSISWHVDGSHIISAGQDSRCHVWDLSRSGERRQAAKWSITTPAPVSRVSWRPPYWSTTANGNRAAQVAVCYDDRGAQATKVSTVHIWDLARPSLPFKEICDFESAPSGLVWHDRDILWTVNRSGSFDQSDVAFAPKVIDRRALSTFDFAPNGDILMLLEERQGRHRSLSPEPAEREIHLRKALSSNQSDSPNAAFRGSRSDSDEDVIGSFLGGNSVRSKRSLRRQSQGNRSMDSYSRTPPSVSGSTDTEMMSLEDAMQVTGPYKPVQVMALGHTPATSRRDVYEYLSTQYLYAIEGSSVEETQDRLLCGRIVGVLEHFAASAQHVGQYRLAQTWKIFAYTMSLLLERRAEYHKAQRLATAAVGSTTGKHSDNAGSTKHIGRRAHDDPTPKKVQGLKSPLDGVINPSTRAILADELESTSTMTTPIARPIKDSVYEQRFDPLSSVDSDKLSLPPAVHSNSFSPKTMPAMPSPSEQTSSSDGYDFYDTSSFSPNPIDISTVPQRKVPLRLDYDDSQAPDSKSRGFDRQDSTGSFEMFSTSADSRQGPYRDSMTDSKAGSAPCSQQRMSDTGSSWDSSGESQASQGFKNSESQSKQSQPTLPSLHIEDNEEAIIESAGDTGQDEQAMRHAAIADARNAAQSDIDLSCPNIIDQDYLPRAGDPQFTPRPIDPHTLVRQSLDFEVKTGVLNAAAMLLILRPLLQPGTIDDIQAAAILRQYHHRLCSMELYAEAAILRKLCYPQYSSVFSQGLHNVDVGLICPSCCAPMGDENLDNPRVRTQKCTKCKTYIDGCAICQMHEIEERDVEYDPCNVVANNQQLDVAGERSTAGLWWYCQGCGHGGHSRCMSDWHGDAHNPGPSEGCCPIEGCLHPCLPGAYRDEFFNSKDLQSSHQAGKLAKENLRNNTRSASNAGLVRKDDRSVGESKAVESVRGSLSFGSNVSPSASLDKKKSVKVVAPGEERRR